MIWALHGFLGEPSDWDAVELAWRRLNPAAAAWRRTNLAELASAHPSFDEASKALAEQAAREAAPWIVGYSMGGRLAMGAFARRPEAFAGAVFLSANPGLADDDLAERNRRREADEAWAVRFASVGDAVSWRTLLEDWNAQGTLASSATPARPFNGARPAWLATALRGWSLAAQPDLRAGLAKASRPSLWLSGERDTKFTAIMRDSRPPSALWRSISRAGHRLLWDAPEAVARELHDFVSRG